MLLSDTSGDETTRDAGRSLRYGKLSIAGFLCLILVVGAAGPVRGALTGAQGSADSPVNFSNFDDPGTDFISFELQKFKKYKFKFERAGVTINVGPGPSLSDELFGFSTNDVNVFEGNEPNSFGIVNVRREGGPFVMVEGQFGARTDGGVPLLDGINQKGTPLPRSRSMSTGAIHSTSRSAASCRLTTES